MKKEKFLLDNKILEVIFIVLLGLGVLSSFFKPETGLLLISTGGIIFIFSRIELFEFFKGLGIEAKLRKSIDEAEEITSTLKDISVLSCKLSISSTMKMGRWGSFTPRKERSKLAQEIEQQLVNLNATKEEIDEVLVEFHWYNIFDQVVDLFKIYREFFEEKIKQHGEEYKRNFKGRSIDPSDQAYIDWTQRNKQLQEQKSKFDTNNISNQPSLWSIPQYIDETVNSIDCAELDEDKQEESKELLEDIQYYCQNKKFRRENIWFSKK